MSELIQVFPSEQPNSSYIRGIVSTQPDTVSTPTKFCVYLIFIIKIVLLKFNFQNHPCRFESKHKDLLKYIMITKLGSGPRCIDKHLINNDGTLKSK